MAGTTPGEALRSLRRALALTPAQLAAAIGCPTEVLCCAETGLRTPMRPFWQRADGMTGAEGRLLRLYDAGLEPDPTWPLD